jgi:hypothetical protein
MTKFTLSESIGKERVCVQACILRFELSTNFLELIILTSLLSHFLLKLTTIAWGLWIILYLI